MNTSVQPTRRALWASALLLCLVCPFMAEVLSSNVTPWGFFALSWGLIPVYGFPILLLREWAVRRGVSLVGLWVAGFGYGLYNEGLIAKTIFLNQKVPWNLFDGRIGWGGVNWGWLLVICAYHALFSVVTPVLLVEKLRPQTAGQGWLSRRSGGALLVAVALVSLTYNSQKPVTLPVGFYLLWGAIAVSIVLGSFLQKNWMPASRPPTSRSLVWIGSAYLTSFLLLSGAFAHGLPWLLFGVGWAFIAFSFLFTINRSGLNGTLAIGLGAYAGMSAMNVIFAHPVAKAVGAVAVIAIVVGLQRYKMALMTSSA